MSLLKRAVSGTIWATGSSVTRALIQILRLSILTRFLTKSDFGLVALVVLFLGFTNIFTDLGISVSLFSKKDISKKEYSSLYWVSLLLAILLYLVVLVLSPFIADFYHLTEMKKLIPIMGLDLIFSTAGRQFRIFREKNFEFKSLAIIDIASLLVSILIAIWLAVEGGGVYSLVLSTLAASVLASGLLIITGRKKHPILWYLNIKEGRSFYKIGLYQTGSQILDYFSSQVDILVIGTIMSMSDLGVYNLIKQLVARVYTLINPIITTVSVPLLSNFHDNMELLKTKYLQMIQVISFINFGIYGLMALLAKECLLIFYGTAYQGSYFILQILCIWGSFSAVSSGASAIIIIKGRTDIGFKWTILRVLINPLFILAGSFFGFLGIVLAQAAFSVMFFPVYWKIIINKIIKSLGFEEFIAKVLPFLCFDIVMVCLFSALSYFQIGKFHSYWLSTITVGVFFGTTYLFINRGLFYIFLNLIKKK